MNRLSGIRILASTLFVIGMATTGLGDDLNVSSFSSFAGQTNILLAATGDITFSGSSLTLPALQTGAIGQFSVQAGNDINILTHLSAGQGWSLSFTASNNLNMTDGSISAADDISIQIGGSCTMVNGGISSTNGNIVIQTGGNIIVNNWGGTTNWIGTTSPGGTITITGSGSGCVITGIEVTNWQGDSGGIFVVTNVPIALTNDSIYIGSGSPPQIFGLNSWTNKLNITAAAGTDVYLFDLSTNGASFSYQWFKDSTDLVSETNSILFLTNLHRTDTGSYSVTASNSLGIVTNSVHVRVLVPQSLSTSVEPASHQLTISFKDNDGGEHSAQDIGSYVVQTSTNLVEWTDIVPIVSTNASGGLSFTPPTSSADRCFFRILSK